MSEKFGLSASTIAQVNSVIAKYSLINKVVIYGSRAKGNFTKGSDVDLTLIGDNLDHRMVHNLELEIDDLLLPYTFDISIFTQIENKELIDHINRMGKTFFITS